MLNIRKISSLKNELTHLFQKGISDGLVAKENPLQQGLKQIDEFKIKFGDIESQRKIHYNKD